ncbi:MAG: DUF2780 domain-containing protein [Thalassotalea sp.]
MKNCALILLISVTFSANANAEGWFDSLKSLIGLGETKEQTAAAAKPNEQATDSLDIAGMIGQVSKSLNVNNEQAEGGVASLLNFAKNNLAGNDFSQLAKSLPGVDGILSKVPDISSLSGEGLGGILDKASEYSDSLKSINEIKKQFEALGLKPEMITQFISQAQSYLNTEQGQQAKALLTKGLAQFTN